MPTGSHPREITQTSWAKLPTGEQRSLVIVCDTDQLEQVCGWLKSQHSIDFPQSSLRTTSQRAPVPAAANASHLTVPLVHPEWSSVTVQLLPPNLTAKNLRASGAKLGEAIRDETVLTWYSHQSPHLWLLGWQLGSYQFTIGKQAAVARGALWFISVLDQQFNQTELMAQAQGVYLARDLANCPSNIKNPTWLANRIKDELTAHGIRISIHGTDRLKRDGFGGLLAVASGSSQPPQLVIAKMMINPQAPTVVLVGKGITYDSGGLSLKPRDAMTMMKTDMTGAAVVTGALKTLASGTQTPAVNIIALLPLAENLMGASSYRPGDVVRHFDHTTSEIINTDAEGRIVMADAIGYAKARFAPRQIVDVATLTGAATLGLSRHYGALMTNDELLADQLLLAGRSTGDELWQLPLFEPYRRSLTSEIADIKQTPTDATVGGGAVTAAMFLQHFVGEVPWAHLDIAGPARAESARGDHTVGGTGFGVLLLADWLYQQS